MAAPFQLSEMLLRKFATERSKSQEQGSVTRTSVPRPTSLVMEIVPPVAVTRALQMLKPSPLPPVASRVRA
jgi:hypothetical protein